MKRMKKLYRYLLAAAVVLLCMLPSSALAAPNSCNSSNSITYSYNCDTANAANSFEDILNCFIVGECKEPGSVNECLFSPVYFFLQSNCIPQALDLLPCPNRLQPVDLTPTNGTEPPLYQLPGVDDNENIEEPTAPPADASPSDNGTQEITTGKPDPAAVEKTSFASEVVSLVNQERAAVGLAPLIEDNTLDQAAAIRAEEIITSFSHTRPDGSSCFTALQQVGASYRHAGENIAIGQTTPAQVVADWMNSPGHRANILNPDFTKIGVGVQSSSGEYVGYAWAQFFTD